MQLLSVQYAYNDGVSLDFRDVLSYWTKLDIDRINVHAARLCCARCTRPVHWPLFSTSVSGSGNANGENVADERRHHASGLG